MLKLYPLAHCSISISDEDKEGYCDTELQNQITSDTFSTFINVLLNKLFRLIHIHILYQY